MPPPLDLAATHAKRESLVGRMEAQLDSVEAEMRRIGFWHEHPPAFTRLRSLLSTLSFELWLQQLFLPNARRMIRTRTLPAASSVGLMAMREYDHHSIVDEALPLVRLLNDFDRLVEDYARPIYASR